MEADSFVRFLKLESDDPMMFSFGTDVKSSYKNSNLKASNLFLIKGH